MELLKQEKEQLFRTEENLTKDQQVQFLQQTMQGMQQVPAPALVSLFSRERDVRVCSGGCLLGKVEEKKEQQKS